MNYQDIPFFGENKVRRTRHDEEWWFSVEDVASTLISSKNSKLYIKNLLLKDETFATTFEKMTKILQFRREKICFTKLEGVFRIIQSLPSTKAEPFKLWLAKLGKKRISELMNN